MSKGKQKGTAAETAVVKALQRLGWPHAERRALAGNLDKGDIAGVPGVCFEVKDAKTWKLREWMAETEIERLNSRSHYGVLVVKAPRVGHANAEFWLTVMDGEAGNGLLWHGRDMSPADGVFPQPPMRIVEMKAVGLAKALDELIERERHCGPERVAIRLKRHGLPGHWFVSRLNTTCKLLVGAGYGGHAIMDATTSNIVKEDEDE